MKEHRIVCAANRFTFADGTQLVVTGVRHWDPLMHAQVRTLEKSGMWDGVVKEEQGFVDNKMQFLNREDAWHVARAAEQIIKLVGSQTSVDVPSKLYSENLY